MSRVAIVIVTYNSALEIEACLATVSSLPDTEIVVVDNASSDGTTALVLSRQIRLIANSSNAGFAAAVNQGTVATTAPFVMILNPDVRLKTDLEPMIRRCQSSGIGGVGGLLIGSDGTPQTGFMARNLPTPVTLIFEILGINHLFPGNPSNWHYRCRGMNPMIAALVDQPAGAFFMFPRYAWLLLNGFDESFAPVWFEDVDFCARLKAAGFKVWYEPEAIATHTGGHSVNDISYDNRQRFWYGNLLGYAGKHYRPAAYRAVCAAVVAGAVLRGCRELQKSGVKSFAVFFAVAGRAASRLFSGKHKVESA